MRQFFSVFFVLTFVFGCSEKVNNPDNEIEQPQYEYIKQIERIYSNDFEKNLITFAEFIYPPRDSVLSVTPSELIPFIPDSNYWYYDGFDGIKIPYAITVHAVEYYSEIIDALNSNQNSFFKKAIFKYKADIQYYESYTFEGVDQLTGIPFPSEEFSDVYVIDMILSWDHYCGLECGLYISHKRVVIFNAQGDLIKIFYDGAIPVAVS